jgi:hypothetical protein
MGLLDQMFGSTPDQTQAMGLLGARMMAGNTAQGFADAGQYMAGAKDRDMARQLQAMQMQQHQLALQKAQREQANEEGLLGLQSQFFRPGSQGQGGTSAVNGALPPELQIGAQPAIPGSAPQFDVRGYTTEALNRKLMNPLEAIKLNQLMAKETPINKLDAKDFTPASVQKFAQTGNYGDLVRMDKLHFGDTGGALVGLDQYTGKPVNSVAKTGNPFSDLIVSDGRGGMRPNSPLIGAKSQIARAGASNVSVTTKQEGEESKAVGKFFGENYADVQKAGFTAQSSINRINRLGQLLDGVDTGKFAPLGLEVAKTAQSVGLNIDPKLSNKEAAVALSSEIALQLRNPSGGAGMPGAMSDADRNFLAGMVPGIEKTPEGRKQIIETAKKLAQRDIEVARMAREYRQKNGTINEGFYEQLSRFSESKPLFGGKQVGPAPAGGGANIDALLKKYGQ